MLDPERPMLTNPEQIPDKGGDGWKCKIVQAIIIVLILGIICLGYKIIETQYRHRLQIEKIISRSSVTEKDGNVIDRETSETRTKGNK